MDQGTSHERVRDSRSDPETAPLAKEWPSTLAGHTHRMSYGEKADPHDQADGFWE